jgi:hypothetical protein
MPPDDIAGVSDADKRDVLAYLLQQNGFTPGPNELPANDGDLAEPLCIQVFDEFADRQLPALVRTRAQTRQLLRIHAPAARHVELPNVDPADHLRVPPRFLIVRPALLRHETITSLLGSSSNGAWVRSSTPVKEYVTLASHSPNLMTAGHAESFIST